MIVPVGDLASDAGSGFAVAWHGSAVVSARLAIATQIAVVLGAAVLMMAVIGTFVVVVVCARFQFSLIAWILVTFLVGMVGLLTRHTAGLEPLVMLLGTLPGVTLLGIPPVAVLLEILPVVLKTLPVIMSIIAPVILTFPAFADLTATVVAVALLHGVEPFGPAFVGKVTLL